MSEKYVSPVSRKTWHSDPENCASVSMPDRYYAVDESYIGYHEIDPCPHCVTGDVDRNTGKSVSNLAKSIRHGTELQD
jgi:hypothetical protein